MVAMIALGAQFQAIPPRWDVRSGGERIERHRHGDGYVAIVVSGWFDEAGDTGRRRAGVGDVLSHLPFQAHADALGEKGARILCLPRPRDAGASAAGALDDLDAVIRIAEEDALEAARMALAQMTPKEADRRDWPDLLAAAIREAPGLQLEEWCETYGLAPATASRGFRRVFGVKPSRYRADVRATNAWRAIVESTDALSAIASACGFADQAHMTRELQRVTGAPPGAWRVKSVQDRARSAVAQ